jgi:uncharacterized glyoxalase superfamily metalloenzyme YdcJ
MHLRRKDEGVGHRAVGGKICRSPAGMVGGIVVTEGLALAVQQGRSMRRFGMEFPRICGANPGMRAPFADRTEMQHRLFAELSRMFGQEVPLYDKSLLVNRVCNETICALLGVMHRGFAVTAAQLEKTSGERHGAIRIGRPDEYRWVARYFAAFALEPHNYYDMTNLGAKSQPIVATAFRSRLNPEHRVFCSLLMTDYFDPATRARIEALLATRQVFSPRARALLEQGESRGGLAWPEAELLIQEGVTGIFKWTGRARDHGLYQDLCAAGFKIAADIACFDSHHLNHLTPNTLGLDLYTAAMKHALGEMDAAAFRDRAEVTLARLRDRADHDYLRLHFKHLDPAEIAAYVPGPCPVATLTALVEGLARRLQQPDLALTRLPHAGFKDYTEGPAEDTPVLLRQDAYKALTEPVQFTQADGSVVHTVHTARFGEIEQRFYATTPAGRELYDRCLAAAEAAKEKQPDLVRKDFAAYEQLYAAPFAALPKQLGALLEQNLVYGRYAVTAAGRAAARAGAITAASWPQLIKHGFVTVEGLRYEDFLPVSAAGIFASNLNQYGTKSTAARKPVYTRAQLEEILGRTIVDPDVTYAGIDAESRWQVCTELGLLDKLDATEKVRLQQAITAYREN